MNFELFNAILSMDSYNRGYESGIKFGNETGNNSNDDIGTQIGLASISFTRGQESAQDIGFYALAYDIGGTKIISYRGTDNFIGDIPLFYDDSNGGDIWNGWTIASGGLGESRQAAMAFEFAHSVVDQADPRSAGFITTGHSLGGGLAGLVGGAYGQTGILFDNMPFELALNTSHNLAGLNIGQELKETIYNGHGYWDLNTNNLETFSIDGEILQATRIFQNSDKNTPYDLGESVSLSAVQKHDMPTFVIQMYGETEFEGGNDWIEASPFIWDSLFNDGFAASIGFNSDISQNSEANTKIQGTLQDENKFSQILRTTLAYSAIDEGTDESKPFGDTAIRAFYNDANDLGAAIKATDFENKSENGYYLTQEEGLTISKAYETVGGRYYSYYSSNSPESYYYRPDFIIGDIGIYEVQNFSSEIINDLSKLMINFSSQLALNDIEKNTDNEEVLEGILDYDALNGGLTINSDIELLSKAGIETDIFHEFKYNLHAEIVNYQLGMNSGFNGHLIPGYRWGLGENLSSWEDRFNALATSTENIIFSSNDHFLYTLTNTSSFDKNNLFLGFSGSSVNVIGSNSRDYIVGSVSDDIIEGGSGEDHIVGHLGDDILRGGQGNDILSGGKGFDITDYSGDYIAGGQGAITVDLRPFLENPVTGNIQVGQDSVTDGWGDTDYIDEIDHFILSQNNDVIYGDVFEYEFDREFTKNRIFDGGDGFDKVIFDEHATPAGVFKFYDDRFIITNGIIQDEYINIEKVELQPSPYFPRSDIGGTLLVNEETNLNNVQSVLPYTKFANYDFSQSNQSVVFDFQRYISGTARDVVQGNVPIENASITMDNFYLELKDLQGMDSIVGSNNGDTYYLDNAAGRIQINSGSGDDIFYFKQNTAFIQSGVGYGTYSGGHDKYYLDAPQYYINSGDINVYLSREFNILDPNVSFSNTLDPSKVLVKVEFDSNNSLTLEYARGFGLNIGRTSIVTKYNDLDFGGYVTNPIYYPDNYNNTRIKGGWGDDILTGYSDYAEKFLGYDGDDKIFGLDGNDNLLGMFGNDFLYGGNGNDYVAGGFGNDFIEGGKGDDTLLGEEGDDIYLWSIGDGEDRIFDSGGDDKIIFKDISYFDSFVIEKDSLTNDLLINIGGKIITVNDNFGALGEAIETLEFENGFYDTLTGIFTSNQGVVTQLPSEDLAFSLEGGAGQSNIPDSNQINLISTTTKTHAMAFETGNDVNSRQVIYEQGGATRGLNIFIENNKLYSAVWNKAEENWGYKQLETIISANTKYTAVLVLDGALPSNGDARLYLNGEQVDSINGVGMLYSHGDDIGVGQVQGTTVTNNVTQNSPLEFQGSIEKIAHYNSVLDVEKFTQLNSYLSNDWLEVDTTPINQNPIAQNDNFVGNEDEVLSGNLLIDNGNGADSDPDGDIIAALSQTITSFQGGSVVIQSNGDFTYTPVTDFFGNDSFAYTLEDNFGGNHTATVTLIINDVLDPVVITAPTNNLGLLLEDIGAQKEIADSNLINTLSTSTKTHSMAFETGGDINSTQIIYEQGGGTRGLNMFVENGKLHAAIWNKAEENWGYKELDVSIAVNTKYTATLVMDGALPSNGTADLYLNGTKVDSVSGVGKLYSHGGDIGIDQNNDDTVINNVTTKSPHSFSGTVQTIAHYNAALSGAELNQLHEFMAQDWLSNEIPAERVIMEFGSVDTTHNSITVDLNHSFENPVVFATMTTFNGSQLAVPRITAIENDSFTLYAQEADYLDGGHANETFSYIVVEKGSWELSDGTILEAGTIDTNKLSNNGFENILFDHDFANRPAILSQVQTNNDGAFVATRQDDGTQNGFRLALQEEEISNTGNHGTETIGWLAIDQGIGSDDGHDFIAGSTGDSFTHAWDDILFNDALDEIPQLIANISSNDGGDASFIRVDNLSQNSARISIQEDQSRDSEINHTTETIDFFAIEGDGMLTGKINPEVI